MTLTPDQIRELKTQLREQVANLPTSQRLAAEQQIESLSPEALETMLNQERAKKGPADSGEQKTIFRSIVDGDIPAIVVEETKEAKALMDIAPISKGHVLIIPKVAVKDAKQLPLKAFTLAKKIAQRISKQFKAKETAIQTENKFGETVIHVIPTYDDSAKDLSSARSKSNKEELEQLASVLRSKKRKPRVKKVAVKQVPSIAQVPTRSLARQRRIP